MVKTASTMLSLGTQAPVFSLPDPVTNRMVSLSDFNDVPVLLVMFICNHCPFVKHVADELTRLTDEYRGRGVAAVAINSNDADNYPDDAPDKMVAEVKARGYRFPYLYDESQAVAKAYHAACTPDFFVFDRARRLVYRGQLDSSRPDSGTPVTGTDLRAALDAALSGSAPFAEQKPSIGCNIKWKQGAAPEYFA